MAVPAPPGTNMADAVMTARPQVSVIIPTRDSEPDLRRCLASLAVDQGASYEVLVVDQQSVDATREVALAAGAALTDAPRPELYAPPTRSRNLGAAAAKGEYLLHLDVDMTVAPRVLRNAVQACRDAGHVALTLEEVDIADGFWAKCKALERLAYRGSVLEGARFVRADVFHETGGYDERLGSGEDWDIHSRYAASGSIGRLPRAIHHHLGRVSLHGQLRKKFGYGRSAIDFLDKHDTSQFSRAMASAYRRSWRRFARQPLHAVGFVVIRAGEVGAVLAGIAAATLARKLDSRRGRRRSRSDCDDPSHR